MADIHNDNIAQGEVVEGTDTYMKRLGTKFSLVADVHNDNISQGEVVKGKHSEKKTNQIRKPTIW